MVKTVRRFSICHDIDCTITSPYRHLCPRSQIVKKFPDIYWQVIFVITQKSLIYFRSSTSNITLDGISSCYSLHLTQDTWLSSTQHKTISIKVTLNRNREKFEKTYVTKSNRANKSLCHKENAVVKIGDRVTATLKYAVEISGIFPEVQKPFTLDFGASDPVLNDVVLVVGGRKFNLNKANLTTHSPYLRELLATGNPKYELQDIAPKVLQELLQIIYHVPEIYDDNVEDLLKAARKFDVTLVTRNCAEFLGSSYCSIVEEEKERLVREYEFETLDAAIQKDFGIRGELDDMVLKVEGERFHVNRRILATHSAYFYTMFFGRFRESGQSEIELKDTDSVIFQSLLEVIYHIPNIHESNVANLLEAARMYAVQPATSQCEKFLMEDSKMEKQEKNRLVEEYELEKLYGFF